MSEKEAEIEKSSLGGDIPVSVVIPAKNEEANIACCLECLSGFGEVVVVDSDSTDRTVEIAEAAGAKVLQFKWDGKFPKKRNWTLRNYSFSSKWVLFLDADERVTEAFKRELMEVLPATSHSAFWIVFQSYFMGRRLKHGIKVRKLPLFRVGAGEYEHIEEDHWSDLDMEIHEQPIIKGSAGIIRAPVLHEDFNGLNAYIRRHNEYSDWETKRYRALRAVRKRNWADFTFRQKVKYRLLDSWLLGPLYFFVSYVLKGGFLDGRAGLIFAVLKMFYFLQIKFKIIEAQGVKTSLS